VAQLLFYVQYRKKNEVATLVIIYLFKKITNMKTRTFSLIAILTIACTIPGMARQRIQIEAVNNDISYSLDLKAIASIFGDSRDLEDFERRINDYDSQISNLDLNNDGDVDYLRVIETSEDNTHLVVIQAILDRDVYQDVATIVVERDRYRRSYVQIIGDPYIYGSNYIIEPVFYRTPSIFSWFWTSSYRRWSSPYYWGYYPRYYSYRHPLEINIYLSHVYGRINHDHYYRYSNNWHSNHAYRMYNSIRRNDYSVRYPERSYNKRNTDYSNRYEMDKRRNSDYVKSTDRTGSVSRGAGSNRTTNDDVYNRSSRTGSDSRTNNYDTRSGNNTRASEPTRNTRTESTQPIRESNSGSRSVYSTRENNPRSGEVRTSENKIPTERNNSVRTNPSENVRSSRPATETKKVESKSAERSSSNQRVSTPSPSKRSESNRSSSTRTESNHSNNDSKSGESGGRR
jgi:hypothetical protein